MGVGVDVSVWVGEGVSVTVGVGVGDFVGEGEGLGVGVGASFVYANTPAAAMRIITMATAKYTPILLFGLVSEVTIFQLLARQLNNS
jgi:hypothetical protein